MQVKYVDLAKQFRDETLWGSIKQQFKTCQFILGVDVEHFESRFADLCSVSYAVALNSGTDALFLALKALNIGPNDEVITVPNSFIATAGAIIAVGAKPVFVDVGRDYNIDIKKIEPAITCKTRAVIPVHLTGSPADMTGLMALAKKHDLLVIEDAAQAVGASIDGLPVGSFSHVGCFSLHPLKNLNICGDGGILVTNSSEVASKVRMLRNHGLKNRDEIEFFGYNSRMDTLQAVIALHVLSQLDRITEKRRENASLYEAELRTLTAHIKLPPLSDRSVPVYHTFVIRCQKRDALIRFLSEHQVETKIHYPVPIHLQKPCYELGYRKGDFPVAERQADEIVSLPIHQHLTKRQIMYVCGLIKTFYGLN